MSGKRNTLGIEKMAAMCRLIGEMCAIEGLPRRMEVHEVLVPEGVMTVTMGDDMYHVAVQRLSKVERAQAEDGLGVANVYRGSRVEADVVSAGQGSGSVASGRASRPEPVNLDNLRRLERLARPGFRPDIGAETLKALLDELEWLRANVS